MFVAFALVAVAVLYRVAIAISGIGESLGAFNFAPLGAIALCGAVYLPRRIALVVPLVALALSDVVLNGMHYHAPLLSWEMGVRYAALAMSGVLGVWVRSRPGMLRLLGASVAGSLLFYATTNTASWWTDAGYAKTWAGWVQALTLGLPGYPPTFAFYRNTLAGDLLFTLLFAGCMALGARAVAAREAASGVRA